MTIEQRQQEIVEQFGLLDGDMEMTLHYLMELGAELPAMNEAHKTDQNIVKGCQSKVWLTAALENGHMVFMADSNTAITKGLVTLLVRVFNHQSPDDILKAEITFPEKIGMGRFIGTQRSNGFAAMVKQMKYYALALTEQAHG
jgi:cysteine desulfuration protein SufE